MPGSPISPVAPVSAEAVPLDLALSFAERLFTRRDTYAVQQADGRYQRVAHPLDRDALIAHLTGAHTIACYVLDRQRQARWLCFDSDAPDGLAHLLLVQHALAQLGIPALREASRRGGHLWLFCTQPVSATLLRGLALGLLALLAANHVLPDSETQGIEVYPSVDALGASGYSQAVRIPFGVHQRSGLVYPFVEVGMRPAHGLSVSEGLRWLLAQPLSSPSLLRAASRRLECQLETALDEVAIELDVGAAVGSQGERDHSGNQGVSALLAAPEPCTGRDGLIAWINANIDLPELVAEMTPAVDLHPIGQGFSGWCPFHDDIGAQEDSKPGTPSLYIVKNWRYGWSWRCYSTNCGAHRPLMQHVFDWLVWMAGGDIQRALSWARTRYGLR